MRAKDQSGQTMAAQALGAIDPITQSLIPALYPSTTYQRDADNLYRSGRVYARADNPTFETAEALLTALEGGAASLCFASGMAAATATFMALPTGAHIIAPTVMYWALRRWLKNFAVAWGYRVDFVDTSDLDAVRAARLPGETKLIWVETPGNPTWTVSDLAALADLAHEVGAILAVDNTVPTPVLTRPIAFGADIVMHSATKYLNGHSDVIAGTLTTAKCDLYWDRITALRAGNGAILGTFEAWLLQRGMRTLFVRVERACQSAAAIAAHFSNHPLVHAVLYPGLPDFPGHAIAKRQMHGGFGGMLSIRVAGGEQAAIRVAAETKIWKRATSLGGVESLIEHRRSVEDAESPCPADLLRLSVGLESVVDLIQDLEGALAAAHGES